MTYKRWAYLTIDGADIDVCYVAYPRVAQTHASPAEPFEYEVLGVQRDGDRLPMRHVKSAWWSRIDEEIKSIEDC